MIDTTAILNRKISFYTLGCKLNFAETSTISKQLIEAGFEKAKKGEPAAVCIVNTCSVTELADKKSRQVVRKIIKENPDAYVIVTGCYAQLKPEEVEALEGVDLVLGTEQKLDISTFLTRIDNHSLESTRVVTPSKEITTFVPSCSSDDRTRFFLKVQDGCDYYCSYCTVPFARGRSRNGSIDDICRQASDAVAYGAREIILTGVNIGDFGKSTGETFLQLIQALDRTPNSPRFRISSIEPNLLTDEIIEFVARSVCFVPHFHIPLQSGCDEVLKLMRRRYNCDLFASRVAKIKEVMPNAFIGVDVIVGTRGETEEYFEHTYTFLESLPVSQLHVFSYSERAGTQALDIAHKVTSVQKQQRSKRLLALSSLMTDRFYRSQQDETVTVLFEHQSKGVRMSGFSANYVKVTAPYDPAKENSLITVRLENYNSLEGLFEL